MEAAGQTVARMEQGRPDFDTPGHIKAAAIDALLAGKVHYTPSAGLNELREAIARKLTRDNLIEVDPEVGVVVTVGCKEAVMLVTTAFVGADDEVIVPVPAWPDYAHSVTLAGGRPVPVTLRAENGFDLDPSDIEAAVTPRTRMIILCTPNNPTGCVVSREALEGVAAIAERHNLIVLSDEIYEYLVYGGSVHHSIASIPGMAARTITVNGFSKAYSMTGWRLGYAAGPRALIRPLVRLRQYTTSCPTTFAQWGAVAAYDGPQDAVGVMRTEFDRRRKMLVAGLRSIPGVALVEPRGAFYAWVDCRAFGVSSRHLANYTLKEARVAAVPGEAYGADGEGHVRLSYAAAYDSIAAGLERLGTAWGRLAGEARNSNSRSRAQ
jgi:aspartate/methionine/tyrosine aminotransferase